MKIWTSLTDQIVFCCSMPLCHSIYIRTIRPLSFKGQIISKSLFGDFDFSQKMNENTSRSNKYEFIRSFFGRIWVLTISFRSYLTFSTFDPHKPVSTSSAKQAPYTELTVLIYIQCIVHRGSQCATHWLSLRCTVDSIDTTLFVLGIHAAIYVVVHAFPLSDKKKLVRHGSSHGLWTQKG